jgi:aspartate aminotransferase
MTDRLSPNLANLKASETVAISAEARRRKAAGEDVLDLGVGEPDFDTPTAAAQAGIQAIQQGRTRYPPNTGIVELRRAIAGHLSALFGWSCRRRRAGDDQLGIEAVALQRLLLPLRSPGQGPDSVAGVGLLSPDRAPRTRRAGDGARLAGVGAQGQREGPGRARQAGRGLIICSPCNPTGAVYTKSEIRGIAEWARDRGIWIIADEIYRRINYGDGPAASFLDLPDELLERVVIIAGASKAYAMTGWRIGAAYAPEHLVKAMAALQSHTTTGANHPAMLAAATAFSDPRVEADVVRMVAAFRKRRDLLVERFRAVRARRRIRGASRRVLFLLPGRRHFPGLGGAEFCTRLMQEEGVALVPGAAFGDDRWVRLSYAVLRGRAGPGARSDLPFHRTTRFLPRRLGDHLLPAAIVPGITVFPQIAWHWESETDISRARIMSRVVARRSRQWSFRRPMARWPCSMSSTVSSPVSTSSSGPTWRR